MLHWLRTPPHLPVILSAFICFDLWFKKPGGMGGLPPGVLTFGVLAFSHVFY
jgi:hypothetical protein